MNRVSSALHVKFSIEDRSYASLRVGLGHKLGELGSDHENLYRVYLDHELNNVGFVVIFFAAAE